MGKVKHISFEELAENLAELFNQVRTEHTTIMVEYATGEKVLIKPYAPSKHSVPQAQSKSATPVTTETDQVSSVGAVYDLDPDSITPG